MNDKKILIEDLILINTCTDEELEETADYLLTNHQQRVYNYLTDEKTEASLFTYVDTTAILNRNLSKI